MNFISCRALGRGLEYVFVNQIAKFSIKKLIICYIKTDRNEPFIKFAETISPKNKTNYFVNLNKVYKIASRYENTLKLKPIKELIKILKVNDKNKLLKTTKKL